MARALVLILFASPAVAAAQSTYFESSWDTATGTSDDAVRDGTTWSGLEPEDGNGLFEVLSGGPGDRNYLRISMSDEAWGALMNYDMPTDRDEHFYFRFYMRVLPADTISYGSLHGIQDLEEIDFRTSVVYFGISSAGATRWNPYVYSYMDQLDGMGQPAGESGGRFEGPDLEIGTWYRIEGHVQFLTHDASAPTIFELRIYDLEGTLLADSRDFRTYYVDGVYTETNTKSLQDYYDEGARFTLRGTSVTWMFGNNGPFAASGTGPIYDVSAAAFGNDGWIGPISGGGVIPPAPDAGPGSPDDAGASPDAGSTGDAAILGPPPPEVDDDGGCSASPGRAAASWTLAAVLLLMGARRRRH